MRSQHHHRYTSLQDWHLGQREKRQNARWVPYSLRWKGSIFLRILPQIALAGVVASIVCCASFFTQIHLSLQNPILFPIFGFIVGLAISFRMQSSYSRWWEGRTEWDKLSAVSRSFARTIWIHVPENPESPNRDEEMYEKISAIRCAHTLAVSIKHHLRGERDMSQLHEFRALLADLPNYDYSSANHPLAIMLYLSSYVEHVRVTTKIDTQVLTHLLTHVDTMTSIVSACERLLRTPVPLGYNIAISRIVWIFIFALPSQLWRELRWWTMPLTIVIAYVLFALAEVGLEIENPWGEGPNDLDLDRYCNLLALDLESTMVYKNQGSNQFIHKPEPSLLDAAIGEQPDRLIVGEEAMFQNIASPNDSIV